MPWLHRSRGFFSERIYLSVPVSIHFTMRNPIFATIIAITGCVLAAAAHGNELPVAWQVDTDLDTAAYQLENTPNFSANIGDHTWGVTDWNTNVQFN